MSLGATMSRLKNKQSQYKSLKTIGKGAVGQVQKCQRRQDGIVLAIKSMDCNGFAIDAIAKQVDSMEKVQSDYVIDLVDHFYDHQKSSYVIVMPYYKLGSLQTTMEQQWSKSSLLLFTYQLAQAFKDLSKQSIIHLDVKPANILIQKPGQYILCDLGCARKMDNIGKLTQSILSMSMIGGNNMMVSMNNQGGGTVQYAAPCIVARSQMDSFCDIWSLGVILYKLIYRTHPLGIPHDSPLFYGRMQQFYDNNYKIKFPQPKQKDDKLSAIIGLVKRMLAHSKDRKNRISSQEILKQIYTIARVPQAQQQYIITNFDHLLQFADNSSIVLSALIHFIEQVKDFLLEHKIDMRNIVRDGCIYLITTTYQLITHMDKKVQDFWEFYIFDKTIDNLTPKQRDFARYLDKQIREMTQRLGIKYQIGHAKTIRRTLVNHFQKMYKVLNTLNKNTKPQKMIQSNILNKIIKIMDFIGYQNRLQFGKRKGLKNFVQELINA